MASFILFSPWDVSARFEYLKGIKDEVPGKRVSVRREMKS